jgi:hypothetical protein
MKKIALVMSMMLLCTGAAQAALEGGDVLVLDTSANPIYALIPIGTPTPVSSRLFNVKPNGDVETLKEFGLYEDVRSVAVAPDGSIIAVRSGNYPGGPTPTPDIPGPGTPVPTPYPAGFWRESAVYRIQPDGSSTIIAQGGLLNQLIDLPPFFIPMTLMGSACDAQGNIYLSHGFYGSVPLPGTPTPHPAILKLSPDGLTLTEFAYGDVFTDNQFMSPPLAFDADGNLYTSLYCSDHSPFGTPTPLPGKILKINPQGTPSVYAVAAPVGDPEDDVSQPFSRVTGFAFDSQGTLLIGAMYPEDGGLSPITSVSQSSVQSVAPDGSFTSLVASSQLGGYGPAAAFCTNGEGTFLGANQNAGAVYAMLDGASPQVDIIASGSPLGYIRYLQFYPPANPPFETWFSEAVLAHGEGVAVGFDIARGRTNNTDDLYFGIQFPASAGGTIQLFNPNAASNGFPLLIDLSLAERYPSEVSKLRYGNATTTVRGAGSVELGSFPSVMGIPHGTYQFLGVMTEPGASLFDSSKWRTPGGQPVAAECVYIGSL